MLRPTNLSFPLSLVLAAVPVSACGTDLTPEAVDTGSDSTTAAPDEDEDKDEDEDTPTTEQPVTSGTTGSTTTLNTGTTSEDGTTGAEGPDTSSTGPVDTSSTGADETTGGAEPAGCEGLPGVLLCEDFEGPAIDSKRWKRIEGAGGSAQIGDERVASGARALHLHIAAEQGSEANLELLPATDVFPVAGNHFFGRVFAHVTPDLPNKHSVWITAAGQHDGKTAKYRLDTAGAGQRFKATYTHPSIEQHGGLQKVGRSVPIGAWVCIEWEFDGTNDEARFWFDGELDAAMIVTGAEDPAWGGPAFDALIIGHKTLQQPDSAPAYDIWMDALVLATERIGCE